MALDSPTSRKQEQQRPPPYELVRSTCHAFVSHRATVNPKAAQDFAQELDVATLQKQGSSLAYNNNNNDNDAPPRVTFDSVEQEVAYILLFHALDFGSGWRHALHRHHRKGAFQTIQAGVERLFHLQMLHPSIPCSQLIHLTLEEVAQAFDLPHNDDNNDELDDLVLLLHQVMVELGTQSTSRYGSQSLVEFVQQTILRRQQPHTTTTTPAADFIWILIDTFPATFDDSYFYYYEDSTRRKPIIVINDNNNNNTTTSLKSTIEKICFYKKAQLVVGEIYHRFRTTVDMLNFADGNQLTAYIDNVICATLRYKGVIVLCPEWIEQMKRAATTAAGSDEWIIPQGSEDEIALRAAACVGIETMIQHFAPPPQLTTTTTAVPAPHSSHQHSPPAGSGRITSMDLDKFLWGSFGKLPKIRSFERHATKTIFY
jgi:Potential Queuosine, Q, salvage protein family